MPKKTSKKPRKSRSQDYTRTGLSIPDPLYKQLKVVGQDRERGMSGIAEEAISAWMNLHLKESSHIAQLRIKKGLSQKELADIVEVPVSTIVDLEEGRNNLVTAVFRICDVLGCSLEDLHSSL